MDLDLIDTSGSMHDQAAQMSLACESLGFFRIPLSVLDRDVVDAAWDTAAEFFALPEAVKREIEFPEPGYPYGYSPFRHETLANSLVDGVGSGPDLKESLSAGPDCSGVEALGEGQHWIRSPTPWPNRPTGLRDAWEAYYRALSGVAEHLMSVMAVALGLRSDYFDEMIDEPITSMRAINYPPILDTSGGSDFSLRAGAHSDYGTLTILRTDDVSGLQIRDSGGVWVDVEHRPDTFVVNLGDSIAQWTNDRWRSTVHRVVTTDPRQRQSFAFFHMANWDAVIECLPTCLDPGASPLHAPAVAGPWLMKKFQSTVASS